MELCHRSSFTRLHLAALLLLLLLLCNVQQRAAAALPSSSALPSYRPGSFLMPWSSDVMSVSLFNASGNNFTTYFGANLSAGSFIVYPQEQLIVMEVDVPPMGYQFFVLEYAPNTAPWPSKRFPWCTSPDNAFMTPFYLNGHFYATKYWQTVYRITFPSIVGADCVMTPTSLTLPMSTLGRSTSLGQSNSVTWISKTAVLQVSADYEGVPFVTLYATHPLNPPPPLNSAFFLIDTDPLTGQLYVTMQNVLPLNRTAFVGTILDNQTIRWEPLRGGWTAQVTSGTRYWVDSRYYADEQGPLLCGAKFFDVGCYSLTNATSPVWSGPPLHRMGSGFGLEATYDPFCS